MDALRGWLAHLSTVVDTPRRRALVGVAVGVVLLGPWPRADADSGPVAFTVGVLLRLVVVVAAGLAGAGVRGSLFGRPLPLPYKQLLRLADQDYRKVESWTSTLSFEHTIGRIDHLEVPKGSSTAQRLPTGVHVRVRRTFQPRPWPAAASVPRPVRLRIGVLFVVSQDSGHSTTVSAHWDETAASGPVDVLRAAEQLGRDVVDAARAVTTDVGGIIDAPDGSAGGGVP